VPHDRESENNAIAVRSGPLSVKLSVRLANEGKGGGMRARDWFEVGSRLYGLWLISVALLDFATAFSAHMRWELLTRTTVPAYIVYAIANGVIGVVLLVGARQVSLMAFEFGPWRRAISQGLRQAMTRRDPTQASEAKPSNAINRPNTPSESTR
jgi:hypothetical protein